MIATDTLPDLTGWREGGVSRERMSELTAYCNRLWCSACAGIGMDFAAYERGEDVRYFRKCRECGKVEEF